MRTVFCPMLVVAFFALVTGCGPTEEAQPVEKKFVLRINCGSEKDYTDPTKNVWKADREFTKDGWGYEGGDITTRDHIGTINKTDLLEVYVTEHYKIKAYRVTCPNDTYSVTLHFAETYYEDPGKRIFDVSLEGKKVLTNFDPCKAAGRPYTAVARTFEVKVTDGELTIEFRRRRQSSLINGIEMIQK